MNDDKDRFIRAMTPIVLSLIGGVVAVLVIVIDVPVEKFVAGMGFASTAVAGASGLSQNSTGSNNKLQTGGTETNNNGDINKEQT
jgi:hypothetical protein